MVPFMAFSNQPVDHSLLTVDGMTADLEYLIGCYEALEIAAKVLPNAGGEGLPALLALVPLDGENTFQPVTHNFIPLDQEDAEYTKYLQSYATLERNLDGLNPSTLLEFVNRMNQSLPLGTCFVAQEEGHWKATLQSVQGYPIKGTINPGVFAENTLLFEASWTLADAVLEALADGKNMDEAFALTEQ